MAAYGLVPKKIYGMNCPGTWVMSVKKKYHQLTLKNDPHYHPGLGSITIDDYDYGYDNMSFLFIDYDYSSL